MSLGPIDPPAVVPEPTPVVPLPVPNTGDGGFIGWVMSHFRPFLSSLPNFVSGAELDKAFHVAIGAGTLAGGLAAAIQSLSPAFQAWAGPSFGPFVGALVGLLANYLANRAKVTDSTDARGKPVQASVTLPKSDVGPVVHNPPASDTLKAPFVPPYRG